MFDLVLTLSGVDRGIGQINVRCVAVSSASLLHLICVGVVVQTIVAPDLASN